MPRRLLPLAAAALALACAAGRPSPEDRAMPTPSEMLRLLHAEGPHPAHREGVLQFGQLVGTWDVQVRFFDAGGACTYDQPGVWAFDWVLTGLAVQDVLVYPALTPAPDGMRPPRVGSTLRAYDVATGTWRVRWVGASSNTVIDLRARAQGRDLVLEGPDEDGALLRWSFTEVTRDTFLWTGLSSSDGGATWRKEQEMRATRRPPR